MNKLKEYNKKRNFNKTKEPTAKEKKSSKKLIFVVQHHIARKDHYDLRLEYNGVLKSWAVPKGPSYNIKDKRLAIRVEDHPYDYKDFEGTIPKGEYGGGTVMVWDTGYWEPEKDGIINFNKPLKFTLKGKRLKGKWMLAPFKDENYLLIKEKDNYKGYKNINTLKTSIKTGKTMKEIENNMNLDNIISSPDKVIFNSPKITKLDIALYYEKVAERMLPFLENRIISTVRCPSGIKNECFFKKHLETDSKDIGMIKLKNKNSEKKDYYYIKNKDGLLSEVQMNSYEFHIWGSSVKSLEKPDIMVFDLDPGPNLSLTKIRTGVKDLKKILDDLGLNSFLKTSGGKGYHIVVPLKTNSWKEHRKIAKSIAVLMEEKYPDKYTSNIRKNKRNNKIFIDWIRNTRGSTSVCPYSIRMKKGAAISMPIAWNELDKIKPNGIKMKDAIQRLKRKDPWEHFFD